MKIGLYISPAHGVPPTEPQILAPWVLVSLLADGLVDRGHEVYLFAAKGSKTKAKLFDFDIAPVIEQQGFLSHYNYREAVIAAERKLYDQMMGVVSREGIKIVHIHQPIERLYPAIASMPRTVPLVFTFHDPIGDVRVPNLKKIAVLPKCSFISISDSQRRSLDLPFAGTVYNGIRLTDFPYNPTPADQYLVAGRVVPEKGFDDAIAAVKQLGSKLIIAGKVYKGNLEADAFWNEKIKPHVHDGNIEMKEFLFLPELVKYYASSKAFLFPIKWEEPFGLVMIEAMATGTPVVAYNRGSVPEIVKDGVTGFIVPQEKGVAGLVEAIKRVGEIDRAACRKHVEEHFSIETMVSGYENVYGQIIGG